MNAKPTNAFLLLSWCAAAFIRDAILRLRAVGVGIAEIRYIASVVESNSRTASQLRWCCKMNAISCKLYNKRLTGPAKGRACGVGVEFVECTSATAILESVTRSCLRVEVPLRHKICARAWIDRHRAGLRCNELL